MKAICEQSSAEIERLRCKLTQLTECKAKSFIEYTRKSGYAHYDFTGTILPGFKEAVGRDATAEDIILLVDGFSHFGASCGVNGNKFSGRINTD